MKEKRIVVTHLPIRLGQFLKLANIVQDGIEAKIVILNGSVLVNGIRDKQRGRKLNENDVVQLDGTSTYRVCKSSA